MPEVLVLQFADLTIDPVAMYRSVSDLIGIDVDTGTGDWPAGLLDHSAATADGAFVVVERWASRADHDAFMATRLAPAFAEAHTPPPVKVSWYTEIGHKNDG